MLVKTKLRKCFISFTFLSHLTPVSLGVHRAELNLYKYTNYLFKKQALNKLFFYPTKLFYIPRNTKYTNTSEKSENFLTNMDIFFTDTFLFINSFAHISDYLSNSDDFFYRFLPFLSAYNVFFRAARISVIYPTPFFIRAARSVISLSLIYLLSDHIGFSWLSFWLRFASLKKNSHY